MLTGLDAGKLDDVHDLFHGDGVAGGNDGQGFFQVEEQLIKIFPQHAGDNAPPLLPG